MNRQTIDQICYKILLSIGESLDLKKMLGKSLATYIGELKCSMGTVLLVDETDSSFHLQNVFSIPRNIEKHSSFIALKQRLVHHDFSDDIITHSIQDAKGIYYVLSISDVGLLVLYKEGDEINNNLLEALRPINHKLGTACKACLQNTRLEKSSQRFTQMANTLPGLIIELDNEYNITFFNQRTLEIFKQIDSDEFHPSKIFDFFPPHLHAEVGKLLHQCEIRMNVTSGDFLMINSRKLSFMVNLSISPIIQEHTLVGFRGIAIDITQRVHLEKDLKLRDTLFNVITRATQELLKSKNYSVALEMIGKANNVNRVEFFKSSFDPKSNQMMATRLAQWYALKGDYDEKPLDLYNEQMPLILEELSKKNHYQAITKSLETNRFKEFLLKEGIKSFMFLPLFIKEQFWGFVTFCDTINERRWSDIECELLHLFAISISESINRSEVEDELNYLYQEIVDDLEIARSVQNYMLPPWIHIDEHILFSTNYKPWATIGGDFFDCIRISNMQYILYIADISGHGIQAALTMTAVKSIINMVVRSEQGKGSPAQIVTSLNEAITKRLFKDNYMTMCFTLLDFESMSISCINAGHPPLFLYNIKTGHTRVIDSTGNIPLGWVEDYRYHEKDIMRVEFSADDVICMVTDGVFECFNEYEKELGWENFLTLLQEGSLIDNCIMLPYESYEMTTRKGYTKRNDDFSFIALQALPILHTHLYKELHADLSLVDEVCVEVEKFVLSHGRNEMEGMKTRLVTSEFLSNVVEHGISEDNGDKIALKIEVSKFIKITIWDAAVEWNPPLKKLIMDDFFDSLNQESHDRGRGLQIIYSLTDSVSRRRVGGVNETCFTISLE